MKHKEEFLDIVDQDDNVIFSLPRSQVYAQQLFVQMRSVWLIIKNNKGQLWIPRRCETRKILPGYLDGSVVGHVKSGESYEQALIREAEEEVGLDLSKISYRFLGKLTPQKDYTFCFASVYECILPCAPKKWNKQEFSEWFWMTPGQILARMQVGEKMKSTLPIIVKKFYS